MVYIGPIWFDNRKNLFCSFLSVLSLNSLRITDEMNLFLPLKIVNSPEPLLSCNTSIPFRIGFLSLRFNRNLFIIYNSYVSKLYDVKLFGLNQIIQAIEEEKLVNNSVELLLAWVLRLKCITNTCFVNFELLLRFS